MSKLLEDAARLDPQRKQDLEEQDKRLKASLAPLTDEEREAAIAVAEQAIASYREAGWL